MIRHPVTSTQVCTEQFRSWPAVVLGTGSFAASATIVAEGLSPPGILQKVRVFVLIFAVSYDGSVADPVRLRLARLEHRFSPGNRRSQSCSAWRTGDIGDECRFTVRDSRHRLEL